MKLFFNSLNKGRGLINPTQPVINPTTSDVVLTFDGNSLTNGTTSSGIAQYYPKQVDANYTGVFQSKEFYSFGVNGQTIDDMIADAATQIYPKAIAGKQNILIGWEDVNAIYGGTATAQQNFDRLVTYFQGAKDAGFQHLILVTGYYPRQRDGDDKYWYGGTNMTTVVTNYQATHIEFLDLVKNTPLSNVPWTAHIDLREDANIGGAINQQVNVHFGDYLHLNASGYDIVAGYVITEINKIFGV